jgi:signal recognition particle GTPase
MERFTEKIEYKDASKLKHQGELAMFFMDIQSVVKNIRKEYSKSDVNDDVVDEINKKIEECVSLLKTFFK